MDAPRFCTSLANTVILQGHSGGSGEPALNSRLEIHCGPQSFGRQAEPYSLMAVLLQELAGCWGSLLVSPGRAAQVHRAETLGLTVPEAGSDLCGLLGEALLPVAPCGCGECSNFFSWAQT